MREAVAAAAHAPSGGRLKPRMVPRGSVKEMLSTRVTTKNDRLRKRRHAEWRLDATIAFDILHRAGRLEEFHNEVFASELRQR